MTEKSPDLLGRLIALMDLPEAPERVGDIGADGYVEVVDPVPRHAGHVRIGGHRDTGHQRAVGQLPPVGEVRRRAPPHTAR